MVIGLTDEAFLLNKVPGSSKKSYGLRSDGKLLHAQGQGVDFSPKFQPYDVIGCGITFVSRKIFFTRNGELLGKPFHLQESYTIFASASIATPSDSLTFCFQKPFIYNLDEIIAEEQKLMDSEISEENVDSSEIFKTIKQYLEYQGYSSTLASLKKNMDIEKPEKSSQKLRSYSSKISERYDSIDTDPTCQTCQTFGKICKFCLKKIMENVEASPGIRLPEARGRCDSVDLASLYLKKNEINECENVILSNPKNDVEIRGLLRQIIFTGNIKEAKEFLRENKPDMLNDELCMLYLAVQEFIELIKINEFYQALDFARDRLGKYKKYQVFVRNPVDTSIFVWEIVGLLAYNNPFDSPLCSLLSSAQLELTADLVNTRIIENSGSKVCILENFLKQALGIQYLYQENIMMVKPSNISIIN